MIRSLFRLGINQPCNATFSSVADNTITGKLNQIKAKARGESGKVTGINQDKSKVKLTR
jgi:hypothetical protein